MKIPSALIAALLLASVTTSAAPAPPPCNAGDTRIACQDSASSSDAQRNVGGDTDTRKTPKADTGRRLDTPKDADADDDDDEDACITKAANGVCLDVDED